MSNIHSLRDLQNRDSRQTQGRGGDDSDSDDDHGRRRPQEYYTGGEKSGVAVQAPRTEGSSSDSARALINDILGKAASASSHAKSDEKKRPSAFAGAGHRLGNGEDDAPAPTSPSAQAPSASDVQVPLRQPPEPELVTRRLTFWQDGFTLEDGPLLRYDDPANQEALQLINSGRAPISLLNVLPGQPVDMQVAHRMQDPYSEKEAKAMAAAIAAQQKKKPATVAAFSGAGYRLGNENASTAADLPGSYPSTSTSAPSASTSSGLPSLEVDSTQPVTSLQIRLADGTRMVARMNHSHTVGDVRRFIASSYRQSRPWAIMTTFPNRDLTDDLQTLKDAGLINAVVVQRML
ncbi:hypothetical protein HDU82_005844 [Entophlyctis luteolus]|nr:hypothetical protein HDU82_005844 [Entophlyctis luteolus]